MKLRNLFLISAVLVLLSACGESNEFDLAEVEYIPFQSKKDGRWGMINGDGEVLFADEFKYTPFPVINGRFLVPNKKGTVDIYVAGETPKQIGDSYLTVSDFRYNVAVALKKKGGIVLLDMDANEIMSLDKINGKQVIAVTNFYEGRALYYTAKGDVGMIGTGGEVVIEAGKYCILSRPYQGTIFAVEKKYEKNFVDESESFFNYQPFGEFVKKGMISVLDKEGAVASEFNLGNREIPNFFIDRKAVYNPKTDEYVFVNYCYANPIRDGHIAVRKKGKESCGIIDVKGDWVLAPSDKYKVIIPLNNDDFIFSDGELCGVAKIDGEVLIRPDYKCITKISDEMYCADEDEGFTLFSNVGEKIYRSESSSSSSMSISSSYLIYPWVTGNGYWVNNDNDIFLIGKDGKEMNVKEDVYNIHFNYYPDFIPSNRKTWDQLAPDYIGNFVDDSSAAEVLEEVSDYAYPVEVPDTAPAVAVDDWYWEEPVEEVQ